ncbi:MAG: MFS transporter [Thermoplasmataceae archaeon]
MTDLSMHTTDSITSGLRNLTMTSLGHFVNDGTVFFFPLLVDILVRVNSLSPVFVTLLLGIFYSAASLFSVMVGRISEVWDRKELLIGIGLALMALGILGFYKVITGSLGPALPYIAGLSALSAGIGSSFYHPLGGAILQGTFSPRSRGKALGINGSMGSVGRAVYPSLLYGFAALLTLDFSFVVFAIIAVISAIFIAIFLRGTGSSRRPPEEHPEQRKQIKGSRGILTYSIIMLSVVTFIRSTASQGIASWIPSYLSNVKDLGISSILGYSITLMFIAAIVGQPIFGYFADRMDKRVLLSISSFGTAAATLAYINSSGIESLVFLVIFGFFTFSGFPLLFSLISEYVPRGDSSMANSVVWGLGNQGGMALGPIIVGLIVVNNYSRLPFTFVIMVAVTVAAGLLVFALPRPAGKAKMSMFG